MPHKRALRTLRMEAFEDATTSAIKRIPHIRASDYSLAKKLKWGAQLRRDLVKSLQEIKTHQDQYGFGPVQLKVLDTLIEKAKRAKNEEDLNYIWRNTCFLKDGPR